MGRGKEYQKGRTQGPAEPAVDSRQGEFGGGGGGGGAGLKRRSGEIATSGEEGNTNGLSRRGGRKSGESYSSDTRKRHCCSAGEEG